GMIIRRDLARAYAAQVAVDARRLALDRRGGALAGSGDVDLAFAVLAAGFQLAYSPELILTHLIPARRLEFRYLHRLGFASELARHQLMRALGNPPRCRPWPLEYFSGWAQCLLAGDLHPRTLALQSAAARGRYAARNSLAD